MFRKRAASHREVLIAGVVIGVLLWTGEVGAQSLGTKPSSAPPLQVDKAVPLLLDDAPAAKPPVALPKLVCYDCHGNFREEPLALAHAQKGITCTECHGRSVTHVNDEANVTPPQVMYPRERIEAKCRECHKSHNAVAGAVIVRWQERGLQRLSPKELVCTDCHGEHRLRVRTVHWNKRTGKILAEEKAQHPTVETR